MYLDIHVYVLMSVLVMFPKVLCNIIVVQLTFHRESTLCLVAVCFLSNKSLYTLVMFQLILISFMHLARAFELHVL